MLEVIRTPELAAQVTLMPVDAFGVDAAIVFSDILPPLVGMGLELDFVKGDGPRIGNPIASTRDVDLLGTPPAEETMSGTLGAIALVRRELESRDIPVIGFAGRALHARELRDRGRHVEGLLEDEGVHALRARRVATAADEARDGAGRLPAGAGRRRRAGAAGVRLLGGPGARARGLPALRRAGEPRALRGRRARGRPGDQLLARGERVSRGSGGLRRRRRRARLAAPARRGVGDASATSGRCRATSIPPRCWPRGGSSECASTTSSTAPPAVPGTSSTSVTGSCPQTPVDNVRRLVEHVRERTSA